MPGAADPLRYDGQKADPAESTGLIIAAIPPGSRVLDVGCGTGSVSCQVRDRCQAEVVGIEPSLERATSATVRGLTVHVGGFPTSVVPAEQSFDVVLFADVLEHMVDPGAALIEARAYLKPGGRVVASIPNIAHWTVRWDLLRGRFEYQSCGIMDATHLRWFTYGSVRRLFESTGYTIVSHTMSAGTTLPDYTWRRPWRWMNAVTRERALRWCAQRWPKLFGCQHIITARII